MKDKNYYVYIMGNERPTLYIGVTNDLIRRVFEHKNNLVAGFTEKYGLGKLLYFETCNSVISAIEREKKIKGWNREWKLRLIRKSNPELIDLYSKIVS
ncbi:MAG TPA: GIY-YIG nuclease family protein [bacterium]|nr:GIY-YIG nuclease family protein [bacterium]